MSKRQLEWLQIDFLAVRLDPAKGPSSKGLRCVVPIAGDPGRVVMMEAVVTVVSTGHNYQLRFKFPTPRVMGVRGKR